MRTVAHVVSLVALASFWTAPIVAQARQAPPGMYKDLDGAIAGNAIILHEKQLFIDDYLIAELNGVSKTLNQPAKHPSNPLLHKHDRE